MKRLPPHIVTLLKELDDLFGLTNYDWYTIVEDKDEEDSKGQKRAMSININEEYQRIFIYFYPCFFKNYPRDQRGYILHEYCHTVMDELSSMCNSLLNGKLVSNDQIHAANERATSRVANLLDGLLLSSNKKARRAYTDYPKKKAVKKKRLRRGK